MARWLQVAVVAIVVAGCVDGATDATVTSSSSQAAGVESTVTTTTTLAAGPPSTAGITTTATTVPTEPPLLEILNPTQGATVTSRRYTFTGVTDPGCAVIVGGRYEATVDPDGSWALELVLNPGGNTTTLIATNPKTGLQTKAMIEVSFDPHLTLRPDGLGDLEFTTPEEDALPYLIDVLGPPDSDNLRPGSCYERILTWNWAGFEAWITDDGGHTPGGGSMGCSRPPALTNWRAFDLTGGLELRTPEGIGIGSPALDLCEIYGQECTGQGIRVQFDPDVFPWDHSRAGIWFSLDKPAEDPSSRIVAMGVEHSGYAGNPGGLTDDYEALVARLQFRAQLVGTWTGTVTTPWTPPYDITLQLLDHGQYGATGGQGAAPAALYWGTNDPGQPDLYSLGRRWEITDADSGVGQGWMSILMDAATNSFAVAQLDSVRLSDNGQQLDFDLRAPYGSETEPGEIHLTATRVTPP